MPAPLIVSIGMPRAGSGWYYNLTHDLVVAAGGVDARWIRQRFLLQPILTSVNCNIGAFTLKRLVPVMIPALLGRRYVIKAHAGPTSLVLRLVQSGKILPAYIFRDPRDALLSAYEYGQRKRSANREGVFARLDAIEQAIDFMREYVEISEAWLACEYALHTRYEDLILDYPGESRRLVTFLGLDPGSAVIRTVIDKYAPHQGSSSQRGTHFVKGKTGRYREKLTADQQQLCIQAFGSYLEKYGYPIP